RAVAGAVWDGTLERKPLTEEAFGAPFEEGLVVGLADAAADTVPDGDRRDGEHREGDELGLPRPVDDQRDDAHQQRREAEPQHVRARRKDLDAEQDAAGDEPVPDAE